MDVQPFRSTRPLLTVAMILLITAVTSCSSSSTTRATAGGVSSTPGATPSAARVTALGQRDVNSLSLRAKQYLNAAAKQYLTPVPNQSGNPTWSVSSSQVASPESGQVPFSLFSPVQGGGNSNRLVARACATTWTTLMHAGFSTRSPFVTAELRGDGEESSDPDLQIGEWDAVAPPAAVTALTQVRSSPHGVPRVPSAPRRRAAAVSAARAIRPRSTRRPRHAVARRLSPPASAAVDPHRRLPQPYGDRR